MALSVGVNLIGEFANSDEIKKNKSLIENILNIITSFICDKDKNDRLILIDAIKDEIKKHNHDIDKICTKTPKHDGTCEEIVFTDKRILDLIQKIKNNTEYRRICKFKYRSLNGNIDRQLLNRVIYSLKYYPYNYFTFPYGNFNLLNLKDPDGLYGGNNENNLGKYGLGTHTIKGVRESIKFVDFDEFTEQYEQYYTVQNNVMQVTSCVLQNGKMDCTLKTYKLKNRNNADNVNNMSDSEEINVLTHGKQTKLDDAYLAINEISKIKKLDDIFDQIEKMLDVIKYYVLPLKTLKKSEQINITS